MIKIGQKVKFNPVAHMHSVNDIAAYENTEGIVKYINPVNRWFSVEYGDDVKLRMAFNFNDIGKNVKMAE